MTKKEPECREIKYIISKDNAFKNVKILEAYLCNPDISRNKKFKILDWLFNPDDEVKLKIGIQNP